MEPLSLPETAKSGFVHWNIMVSVQEDFIGQKNRSKKLRKQHISSILISEAKKDTRKEIPTLLINTDIKGLNKMSVKESMETKRRKSSPGKAEHFPQTG